MKTSKQMAAIITKNAEQLGTDLRKPGSHLRLENPPYMPLSLDVLTLHTVAIAHNYVQNGDVIPDPDMQFFTRYGVEGGWVPVAIQQQEIHVAGFGTAGGYKECTWLGADGQIDKFAPRLQAEQASFANMWARNIKAQGFLDAAKKRTIAAQEIVRQAGMNVDFAQCEQHGYWNVKGNNLVITHISVSAQDSRSCSRFHAW